MLFNCSVNVNWNKSSYPLFCNDQARFLHVTLFDKHTVNSVQGVNTHIYQSLWSRVKRTCFSNGSWCRMRAVIIQYVGSKYGIEFSRYVENTSVFAIDFFHNSRNIKCIGNQTVFGIYSGARDSDGIEFDFEHQWNPSRINTKYMIRQWNPWNINAWELEQRE